MTVRPREGVSFGGRTGMARHRWNAMEQFSNV